MKNLIQGGEGGCGCGLMGGEGGCGCGLTVGGGCDCGGKCGC